VSGCHERRLLGARASGSPAVRLVCECVCVCVCVCVISALLTLHQDITESTLSKETYNRVKRDLVQYSSHSTTSLTHSLTHLHTIYM
jgi:hypothetical protein